MHHSLSEEDVSETLGLGRSSSRNRILLRWSIFGLSGLVLAALVVWYLSAGKDDGGAAYVTAPVERRDLVVTVTATGTLEPTNEVEVSSELSGMIRWVFVDNNDPVDEGQILAELDTDKLEAQVTRARAALTAAKARVKEAEAAFAEARRNFQRYSELARKKVVSEHELDVARATYKRAMASLESVTADVQVAQADLDLRETDLKKACICSPISGVVLRRNVDPGQTVAATLQAPVLFTLAEDLTAMELHVDVDEADISLVEEGQTASFTVDAYPDRTFPARITKVRFAP
ncbi:MAG: efflux RND transporter periplasmic adaptor subunit, partial [Alphaproteobacteria bacterium]|nr:efflux RND transporter periplasmic adaptor subunit [Alphaproteobacteria bacterium]